MLGTESSTDGVSGEVAPIPVKVGTLTLTQWDEALSHRRRLV
jgi:hypothetical protein